MRRTGLPLLLTVLLAACSSAPVRTGYSGGAYGTGGNSGAYRSAPQAPAGLPRFVDHSVGAEEISIEAMSLVGVPYRWGGNTPESGFDCSGLVDYVVRRAASVKLPRTTDQIGTVGSAINPDEIAPGDLIFFNTTGRAHSHVGIYVGQYRFVNAPSTGGTVRLDYVTNPYWAKRFDGIRRVAQGLTPRPAQPFDAPHLEAAEPAQRGAVPPLQADNLPPAGASLSALQPLAANPAAAANGFAVTSDTGARNAASPLDVKPSGGATGAAAGPLNADPIAQFAGTSAHDDSDINPASQALPRYGATPAGAAPPALSTAVPASADNGTIDPIARFASGKF
jgi:hypothetical protein